MSKIDGYFDSAKKWNFVLIFAEFLSVFAAVLVFVISFLSDEGVPYSSRVLEITFGVIIPTIISIIFLVLFIKNSTKLKNHLIPTSITYYLQIIWTIIHLLIYIIILGTIGYGTILWSILRVISSYNVIRKCSKIINE
ncbi:hypothetical protein [Floricoccus penangensis]|uniref:hypothetical protein n=1 Tax=Floricoccus penangensis TaxID=1859475 RepID=UPI001300ECDA|nr:hypothetical protein [Floricoccus penangensis]